MLFRLSQSKNIVLENVQQSYAAIMSCFKISLVKFTVDLYIILLKFCGKLISYLPQMNTLILIYNFLDNFYLINNKMILVQYIQYHVVQIKPILSYAYQAMSKHTVTFLTSFFIYIIKK